MQESQLEEENGAAASPLDDVVWASLTTHHSALAIGDDRARRYPPDIVGFAAMRDHTLASFASLRKLVQPGDGIAIATPDPRILPDDFSIVQEARAEQLLLPQQTAATWSIPAGTTPVSPLSLADVPEMQALVALAKPGKFGPRVHEVGRYFGIRVGRELVAMAGERLRPAEYTEISAVCCHPDHRGRGYARDLVSTVMAQIFARGELPFLHTGATNLPAMSLYRKLGFVRRKTLHGCLLKRAEAA